MANVICDKHDCKYHGIECCARNRIVIDAEGKCNCYYLVKKEAKES